jgi:ArsR family transcriptional regulator
MKDVYIRVFRAFTDEHRVRILQLLRGGEQCACVLLEGLNISQPTLSHHMKILCASGIVKSRRVGRWNYYTIDADGCAHASRLLTAIAGHKLDDTLKFMAAVYRLLRLFGKRKRSSAGEAPALSCCLR